MKRSTFILASVLIGVLPGFSAALDLLPHLDPGNPIWGTTQEEMAESVLVPGRFRRGNPSRSTTTSLGDMPLDEVLLAWTGEGRLNGLRLIVVTRGETRDFSLDDLERIQADCETLIQTWTATEGRVSEERMRHASFYRKEWALPDRTVVLTSSRTVRHVRPATGEVVHPRAEFVRIDILPLSDPEPSGSAPAVRPGTGPRAAADRRPAWSENVERRTSGDVVILHVPMVDQGERGYCAVATIARMMMYYGMDVDQHEIAQLAHASPTAGTNSDEMMDVLRRSGSHLGITSRRHVDIDVASIRRMVQQYNQLARRNRMETIDLGRIIHVGALYAFMDADLLTQSRMRLQAEYNRFLQAVRRYVDDGVPLAWSLVLGKVPEEGRTPQTGGGHMRLIIGYNDTTEELLFSDSWGAGHEEKRIRMDHAWAVTTGLYTIEPR